MSKSNGSGNGKNGHSSNGKPAGKPDKGLIRDEKGLFVKGTSGGGGGRPKGRLNFLSLVVEQAAKEAEPYDVQAKLWAVIKAMMKEATQGNVRAAEFIADRFFGKMPATPSVALQVNGNVDEVSVAGPQLPEGEKLVEHMRELEKIAKEQGLW